MRYKKAIIYNELDKPVMTINVTEVDMETFCYSEPCKVRIEGYNAGSLLTSKVNSSVVPEIKKVIFNYPATIVIWADDTKTVVKAQNDELFDLEKGLAMAISKKAMGNKGSYCNTFKKWIEAYKKEELKKLEESLNSIGKLFKPFIDVTSRKADKKTTKSKNKKTPKN